jgi:exportin-T
MVNLLAHFEGSELVDFINFVNLLVHKLQVGFFYISLFPSHIYTY